MHGKELKIVLSKLEKKHIKGIDDKINDWECKKCNFTTAYKIDLVNHVQAIHDKVKNWKCKQCKYSSAYKYALKNHVGAVHDGQIFTCKKCNYKTGWKSNLGQHIKSVHQVQGVGMKPNKELKIVIIYFVFN